MTLPPSSRRLRARLLALAAAACLAGGAAHAQSDRAASRGGGDHIVAVVNSELVTSVEVAQRVERASAEARRAGARLPDPATLRQQVLDALIDERVQVTFARDTGQRVDDAEIDRALANIAAQNQISVAQLRERMKADGMDLARFRNQLRDQIMVERVREREVNARIRITDADIERQLAEQRAKSGGGEQLNLAQILVTVPEGASPEVLAQRQARIGEAAARLRAGEDFARVARAFSEDPNKDAGGELGLRPAARLPDLFTDAVRGLPVGGVTPQALRSPAGFHLLKVVDRQEPGITVKQTRARHILLRVSDRAQTAAVAERLAGLRAQIERGEKRFEDVARAVSEDGTAPGGGDLGWASPGQYVPEFEEAMNGLPVGGLSAPVVSRFGVHLVQVMERRQVTPDPKEVRELARAQLREQRFEQAYQEWAKELRLRAYIELRDAPQ